MLNEYLKGVYGRKLYKISIDAGFSCPNRDGTCGYGGCIFCSEGGSGDFAESAKITGYGQAKEAVEPEIKENVKPAAATKEWLYTVVENGKKRVAAKFHPESEGANYIAYFQAFTNTYAPVEKLRLIFTEAIMHPDVAILSVATRPDCVGAEVIGLLEELNQIKPVWVELGLQTIHEKTAEFINRGYRTEIYDDAVRRLNAAKIRTITHVILGLPGETKEEMLQTVRHVVKVDSWGIKLQMLHILKGTKLEKIYAENPFPVFTLEEYVELVGEIVRLLPENMVIHRLTGDGPKSLLIEPQWSGDKKRVINALRQKLG